MKRLQVFLSSAMNAEEFPSERAVLTALFQFDGFLSEFAELYAIEHHTSSQSIQTAYRSEVADSDVVVVLLNKSLRAAVAEEFRTAKENNVRLLVFLRERTDSRDPELAEFVSNEAYQFHCGSFCTPEELSRKVRDALMSEMLRAYRQPLENKTEAPPIVYTSDGPGSVSLLFDAATIAAAQENPQIRGLNADQLMALSVESAHVSWDFRSALLFAELAILKEPGNWQHFHNKAHFLTEVGRSEQALLYLKRALELNPKSDATIHNLGIYYYQAGDYAQSADYFQKALSLKPDKVSSLSYLINIAFHEKQYMEALAYAKKAFDLKPDALERGNLAVALALNGDIPAARAILAESPVQTKEYFRAANWIEELAGNYEMALSGFDEFFRRYGFETQSCVKKAHILARLGRSDDLRRWMDFLTKQVPLQAADYNNIGYALLESRADRAYAAELFERALALDPKEPITWINLQNCYQEPNELEQLVAVSHRAIVFHPRAPGIQQNLMYALALLGRFDDMIDAGFDSIARMFPQAGNTDEWTSMKRELKNMPEIRKLAEFTRRTQELQKRFQHPGHCAGGEANDC